MSKSKAELFIGEFPDKWREILQKYSKEQLKKLKFDWSFWGRPEQRRPIVERDWDMFLISAGRYYGKSRTGSEWVRFVAENYPGCRIGLVAPTAKDVRDIQVLGKSGILSTCPPGSVHYERSKSRLVWKNGSSANMLSADEPDRIRGYNFHFAWFDEIFQTRYEEAFDMLRMTLREGNRPQLLMTTTPRVNNITFRIVDLINSDKENYKFQSGSSYENTFAPESFIRQLKEYENTSLGQQEIHAVILREVTGALFKKEWFKYHHQFDEETGKKLTQEPFFKRTVIAVDIATTKKKKSDFTAICVASEDEYGNYYVRHIEALKMSPNEWAEEVIRQYIKYDADVILVEVNQGGDLVSENLRRIKHLKVSGKLRTVNGQDLPIKEIRAYKGKRLRAEPVALLYERGKVIHMMSFAELESQMCTFTGDSNEKDDLLDSAVYALRELSSITDTSEIFTPLVDSYTYGGNIKDILL